MARASQARINRRAKPRTVTLESAPVKVMSYNKAAVKEPFRAVPATDDICTWLGKIAITWAAVETRINELISALGEGQVMPDGWHKRGFKSRRTLCRDLSKVRFCDHPSLRDLISKTLSAAGSVHWKRNILLHGELTTTLKASPGDPLNGIRPTVDAELKARGEHNGQAMTLVLATSGVEDVFYEIGHCLGLVYAATDPSGDFEQLSSPEKQVWRDFLAKGLPPLPK